MRARGENWCGLCAVARIGVVYVRAARMSMDCMCAIVCVCVPYVCVYVNVSCVYVFVCRVWMHVSRMGVWVCQVGKRHAHSYAL